MNAIFLVLTWIWGILGCWLLFIPLIKAIKASIRFTHTEYLVTNKNVMEKYGVFRTQTNEIPLDKLENIVVTYTFWGKVFNYGNIYFQGANNNCVYFVCVKDAEKIKKQINTIL